MLSVELFFALSHFNEVLGPEVITMYPFSSNPFLPRIKDSLPELMDLSHSEFSKDTFIFANQYFMSNNVTFSIPKLDARGAEKDYLLSILLTPTDSRGLIAILGLNDLLPILRETLVHDIINFHKNEEITKFKDAIYQKFEDFFNETQLFVEAQLTVWGRGSFLLNDFDS